MNRANNRFLIDCLPFYFIPAVVFLANPNVQVLDILPDALAYALLLAAFRRLSWIDTHIEEASVYFRRLIWITAMRLLAWYWASTQTADTEMPILLLLFSMTFGILELVMAIPAFTQLFSGISYLAMRYDGVYALKTVGEVKIERLRRRQEKSGERGGRLDRAIRRAGASSVRNGRSVTERMSRTTVVFLVAKEVLSFLPELSSLADNTALEVGAASRDWYQFVELFRLCSVTVCFVFSLVWLCRMLAYYRGLTHDFTFSETLDCLCNRNAAENPLREQNRAISNMATLCGIAMLFFPDFYADSVNIIPAPVGAALLLMALFAGRALLTKREKKTGFAVCTVCFILSVASYIATYLFLSYYGADYTAVLDRNVSAYWRYVGVMALNGAESVAQIASVVTVILLFWRITARRAGALPGGIQRRKMLNRRLILLIPLAVLSAAAHITYLCLPSEYSFSLTVSFGSSGPRQLPVYLSVFFLQVAVQLLFAILSLLRFRDYGKELTQLVAVDTVN